MFFLLVSMIRYCIYLDFNINKDFLYDIDFSEEGFKSILQNIYSA